MDFDVRTLIFAGAVVSFITGGVLLIARRGFPRVIRGTATWAAANFAQGTGTIAIGMRAEAGDLVSVVLGSTLVVAGHILQFAAIRRFRQLPVPLTELAVLAIAVLAGIYLSHILRFSPMHVTFFSLGAAIPIALSVKTLLARHASGDGFATSLTAGTLAVLGLIIIVRMLALYAGAQGPGSAFGIGTPQLLFFALYDALLMLATFGFFMMANDRLRAELQRLAMLDPLTDVLNRRSFVEFAHRELARAQRHGRAVSLLMIDLDRFKLINDRFGHESGDKVLKHFVHAARGCLRGHDLFARYGGEEFCVLLPDTPLAEAHRVAERLRETVARSSVELEARSASYTVSIGVASSEQCGLELEPLLQAADSALYRAKELGRNRSIPAHSAPAQAVGT